ncbi:hypothetical protein [Bradyrhizobium sp. Gha]|nr:hypothetical protein [Bradyrhizobium sp. Gha]
MVRPGATPGGEEIKERPLHHCPMFGELLDMRDHHDISGCAPR